MVWILKKVFTAGDLQEATVVLPAGSLCNTHTHKHTVAGSYTFKILPNVAQLCCECNTLVFFHRTLASTATLKRLCQLAFFFFMPKPSQNRVTASLYSCIWVTNQTYGVRKREVKSMKKSQQITLQTKFSLFFETMRSKKCGDIFLDVICSIPDFYNSFKQSHSDILTLLTDACALSCTYICIGICQCTTVTKPNTYNLKYTIKSSYTVFLIHIVLHIYAFNPPYAFNLQN